MGVCLGTLTRGCIRCMRSSTVIDTSFTGSDMTAWRIGSTSRSIREGYGWSLDDFSHRVGIAPWVVLAIEDGSRLPTLAILYRFAAALQVPPGELLPSPEARPRIEVHLPITDEPDSSTAQIVGGGPGNPTQTYLFDLRAGEGDGGFDKHPGDEFLVVMEGEVVVSELDRPDEIVSAGQSRPMATHVPHAIRAGETGPARFLLVCTDA
jgi:transcriptional regulator with XRE-family HTH domain